MENTFQQIFKREYNRASFTENILLPVFQNSVKEIKIFDEDAVQKVSLTETDLKSAKGIFKYGEITTNDNRQIDLYEVTLQDTKKVKLARVGIGALVKKLIIGNNAAFVNFRYQEIEDRHWRFSFIAYDSFFEDGQVISKETNPKRYTYVFGDKDETYRTAIDRFLDLYNATNIKVKDIQDAFAVEAMSDEFFKEYREVHYQNFIRFLTGEEIQKKGSKYQLVKVQEPSNFLASVFNGNSEDERAKKEARDFCKKLLGQIVFLYFLQKKGWLGASNTDYQDGDKNFIQNFFKQAGENDTFYPVWLSKLFYDTLNEKRNGDDFTMPNGDKIKIPYLNGGLFEKENSKYDFLVFPADLFTSLFEFFNRFNFTIYENSPEEHTIAVDPEMLGHIFENLLEDNKDKGAFYTPKEIVQYMTQESLIEYLATHIGQTEKKGISTFVKQKNKELLSDKVLKQIDCLLDDVKVCDPAIGSGAFPMGLLQEIFMLKERIAFDLGFSVWSPATVKENIIQNSIYGVDIEKGAVDIAQLRFWLSLVVDEDKPKPLPNLAYKIVVGNSLVSKFGDEIIEIDWEVEANTQFDMFGSELENQKSWLLNEISKKQKQYFTASNNDKKKINKVIRKLKLDILATQLELMIETRGTLLDNSKKKTKKQTEAWLETEGWKRAIKEINVLKKNDKPFEHFDWKLDFPEILNPLVNENAGFDIVIGNPPYIESKKLTKEDKDVFKNYKTASGKFDVFCLFIELSENLLKEKGIHSFINPTTFFNKDFGKALRNYIHTFFNVLEIFDFNDYQVFPTAITYTGIFIFQKNENKNNSFIYQKLDKRGQVKSLNTLFLNKESSTFKETFDISLDEFQNKNWVFINPVEQKLILDILSDSLILKDITKYIFVGIQSGNDSVFFIEESEIKKYNLEMDIIFPILKGKDVKKYNINWSGKYVIYPYELNTNKVLEESEFHSRYPNAYQYLLENRNNLSGRSYFENSSKQWFELWCERNFQKFQQTKIVNAEIAPNNRFQIDYNGYLGNTKIFSTVLIKDFEDKYLDLLGLLNSKILNYYHKLTASPKAGGFYDYKTQFIEKYPIKFPKGNALKTLVSYVLYLNDNSLNSLSLKLKTTYFEQIIDGIVYEIYFPELLKKHNRTIIEHLGELPAFKESTTDTQKQEIIDNIFKRLDDKNHPVRNNLFYMSNIEEIAIIEGKNN